MTPAEFRASPREVQNAELFVLLNNLSDRLTVVEDRMTCITSNHYRGLAEQARFELDVVATEETNRAGLAAARAAIRGRDNVSEAFHPRVFDPIYGGEAL